LVKSLTGNGVDLFRILGAFYAAVKGGFSENLHAVFCLAENSVGPRATRPDDIHTLYSGKTVEINNTDAEGRLVVSDGVVFAKKYYFK
jgi:probable aminopeptidase NPEPL1